MNFKIVNNSLNQHHAALLIRDVVSSPITTDFV